MSVLLIHLRCLLFFFILVQSVSPYKIYPSDDNYSDLSSSSFNQNSELDDDNEDTILYTNNDENKDTFAQLGTKTKRSISSSEIQSIPQRRNNRPHWNPLVAAYKRCGELISREERESCFKEAVQMLFVYKLRK